MADQFSFLIGLQDGMKIELELGAKKSYCNIKDKVGFLSISLSIYLLPGAGRLGTEMEI